MASPGIAHRLDQTQEKGEPVVGTPVEAVSPLDDRSLGRVMRNLRDSGIAVIDGVYPRAEVDRLNGAYQDLLAHRPKGMVQPTSGENHVQMQLPLAEPFSDEIVVAHPVVVQVMSVALGPDFECCYFNSNTAYFGSTHQPVHRDHGPVFGTQHSVPTPPTGFVANIPLCDFTVDNGSTELWPGTHLIVDTPDDADVTLDERAEVLPSSRLDVEAGSLVLRDMRLWHRGTPNTTERPRSMIAVVYKRHWLAWRHPALRVPMSTWDNWPEHVRSIFRKAPRDDEV
jgi:Phytanoyl-CoA dioxygenase (PhyH)